MAQIFISHSSKNNAAAVALRNWIITGGWDEEPFLDLDPKRGIAAGERWERALHEAADRCEVVLFLVARAWLESEWCLKEFHLAQKLNKRVFGVLVEDIPVSDLPATLTSQWQVVNLASGNDHDLFRVVLPDLSKEEHVTFSRSGLARLKAGLDKAGLDPRFFAWPPEAEPDRAPYPGLKPLGAEDAGIFFGREAPTIAALDRLRGLREGAPPRLLVILGASGAGKSSFLRAGLIPRLARDSVNFLPLPFVRPDTVVLTGQTGFIASLEQAFRTSGVVLNRSEIVGAVRAGAAALLPLLERLAQAARAPDLLGGARRPAPPSLVLPIDQGEELFLAEASQEAQAFLALLRDLLIAAAPSFVVLVTIRSDSYERLQTAKALEGLRQETFGLPPMPRGAYQTIIQGPALRLRDTRRPLKVEPALTETLLRDIEDGGGKDALPLLAFTLERLYREYGADGDLLAREYEALGGLEGSIQAAVDAALKAADGDSTIPRDREARLALLRRALIPALAGIDPETGVPRRRVAKLREIPTEARGLVDCLVDARLLATDSIGGETFVEPAHEALLRQWDVLRKWLVEDSAALLALEGMRSAARDWETKGRSDEWLGHSAGRLEDAEELRLREDFERFVTPLERAYLDACRAAENRRRNRELEEARKLAEAERRTAEEQKKVAKRTRTGLVVASMLAIGALGAAWFGFHQARIALTNAAEAEKQTARARANETTSLAAFSGLALERGRPLDAVQLALAAWPRQGDEKRPQTRRATSALSAALPQMRERLRLKGHGGGVNSAGFSPDGARIITGSDDQTARIWDAATGRGIGVLRGPQSRVGSAAFSPDGLRIVTASVDDNTARIWHTATGQEIGILRGHEHYVRRAAFSPNGAKVVTASNDKTARIWDVGTAKEIAVLRGHEELVDGAAFSPDGSRIVTASMDSTARIWDTATGKQIAALRGHGDAVHSAQFSPDGSRIVTASNDQTVRIWDAVTGQEIASLGDGVVFFNSAAYSPDGTRIVTSCQDHTVRIWDAATRNEFAILRGHEQPVSSAAFSPDGARIVTASVDGTARIWDAGRTRTITVLPGLGEEMHVAALSPDGARIVTASQRNTAVVWDAATGQKIATLRGHDGFVNSVAFSPDGTRITTASNDKTARIFDTVTGREIAALRGHENEVRSAAFSPDGARIVTASSDNTARIWDTTTGLEIAALRGHGASVNSAAFSRDGSRIVTASWDSTARIWDTATGLEIAALRGHRGSVHGAAFSPDGSRIVTASSDGTAGVWDTTTGQAIATLRGHTNHVNSAAFSPPDGARVVTASADWSVRIWDPLAAQEIAVLHGHASSVDSAAFSPNGSRIITASYDGAARIWDVSTVETGDGITIACARLGNNTDLGHLSKLYGLKDLKPICGEHKPHPVEWTKVVD